MMSLAIWLPLIFFAIVFAEILIVAPWHKKQANHRSQVRLDKLEDLLEKPKDQTSIKVAGKEKLVVSITPKNEQSCPLCWDIIDSCVWYCRDCLTLYHIDCLEEMSPGNCPTTGCGNKFLELRSQKA